MRIGRIESNFPSFGPVTRHNQTTRSGAITRYRTGNIKSERGDSSVSGDRCELKDTTARPRVLPFQVSSHVEVSTCCVLTGQRMKYLQSAGIQRGGLYSGPLDRAKCGVARLRAITSRCLAASAKHCVESWKGVSHDNCNFPHSVDSHLRNWGLSAGNAVALCA